MSAETALAAPLLMLILLAITQFALWSHAAHIAQTAAAEGLAATRVHSGTTTIGESRARATLNQHGDGPLHDATVHATRTVNSARVEVKGVAASVLPFLHLPVHAETEGPVEQFVPDTDKR
ncbi:TadE/TadG family type IV pilus assembly protein [Actinophytocola sp. KF-1]